MKKRFLLLSALLLTSMFLHAQTEALNSFVEQHKNDPAFSFAFISKELFDVTIKTDVSEKDWKKVRQVVKNIGSLRILAADSITNGVALYKEVYELIPTDEFSELLSVRDGKTSVRIWVKDEADAVTDLILLVGAPEDFMLISFSGNIELGDIASLAAILDSDEVDDLIQTSKKAEIDFKVSPNPSKGDFNIRYQETGDAPSTLTLIDQNGRPVSTLHLSGQPEEKVRMGQLPAGLYWLQLQTQRGKVGVKQVQIVR
jgi:hypothetical protein